MFILTQNTTLRFIWQSLKPHKRYVALLFVACSITALYYNLNNYLLKLIADNVSNSSIDNLYKFAAFYLILNFIASVSNAARRYAATKLNRIRSEVTGKMLKAISSHDIDFFQNNLSGSTMAKIKEAGSIISKMASSFAPDIVSTIVTVSIAFYIITKISVILSLMMLVWILFFTSLSYRQILKGRELNTKTAKKDAKIWGSLVDYLSNMVSVKYFASSEYEENKVSILQDKYNTSNERRRFWWIKLDIIIDAIYLLYSALSLYVMINLYKQNQLTAGDFIFILTTNYRMIDQLFYLTHLIIDATENWATVSNSLQMIEIAGQTKDIIDAAELKVTEGNIIFENISFGYKDVDLLFKKQTIEIKAGERVGLVGYSGSGKTTLVNLLLRLYCPLKGRVLIDDTDIASVTGDSLRQNIAVIPQDPALFHRSIFDNIAYGKIGSSEADIIAAAKGAKAHDFIQALPDGYSAKVGEKGVKMSGGQRQRLAIARAILKNAPIIILDEATSALDSVTEAEIQESIWALMQGRTALVIAHRLSTLLHMDRIIVMSAGEVIQDGNHQELLAKEGLYKTLWQAQSGGYLPE